MGRIPSNFLGKRLECTGMKTWLSILAVLCLVSCNRPSNEPITGVETFEFKAGDHREGRISYDSSPPTGGPHNPGWQNCGVYNQQIGTENAVHSLEHGAVWITYQPNLPQDQAQKLRLLSKGRSYLLVSPYQFGGLDKPIYLTAWNHRLAVESADDPRIERFIQKYMQGEQTPEKGASCSGAVGNPVDPEAN